MNAERESKGQGQEGVEKRGRALPSNHSGAPFHSKSSLVRIGRGIEFGKGRTGPPRTGDNSLSPFGRHCMGQWEWGVGEGVGGGVVCV